MHLMEVGRKHEEGEVSHTEAKNPRKHLGPPVDGLDPDPDSEHAESSQRQQNSRGTLQDTLLLRVQTLVQPKSGSSSSISSSNIRW